MHEPTTCVACQHSIDDSARVCPYCGANPQTGVHDVDTRALLQEVFQPRSTTKSEDVLEYARQRQGLVITAAVILAFLVLAGLHHLVTVRNERAMTDSPPVPLTELTDVTLRTSEAPQPLPDLKFPYEGRPRAMQTFIVESGAVAPLPAPPPATPAVAVAPQTSPAPPVTRSP